MSTALIPVDQVERMALAAQSGPSLFRTSTDAAGLCREIVLHSAKTIQGRKFVQVEGWQAIAIAHGCAASSGEVKRTEEGGFLAVGRVINMTTGVVVAEAEGYVGTDEPVWFGGKDGRGRTLQKRPDYAIRAMAQTRAISRACRSAFAHVVVMMNAGLSTTPAEEVPDGGFHDDDPVPAPPPRRTAPTPEFEEVDPPPPPPPPAVDVDKLIDTINSAATREFLNILWQKEIRQMPRGKDYDRVVAAANRRSNEIRAEQAPPVDAEIIDAEEGAV
jgi:hypothetical protein